MKQHIISRTQIAIGVGLGLLAFLIRIPFIAFYNVGALAGRDPFAYWSFAEGIASGNGFRSTVFPWIADRPPFYSYFLAGIFRVFGEQTMAVFIVQALLAALTTCLFCWLVTRILGSSRGIIAGVLYAVFPDLLIFTKQILTEAIYIPLIVVLISLLIIPTEKRFRFWQWLAMGLVLGMLMLTRREAIFPSLVLILPLGYLYLRPNRRQMLIAFTIMGVTALITVLPWIIRNWQELGVPVLSSSAGYNFMVGNNPDATGEFTPPPADWATQFEGLSELDRDRLAQKLSMTWLQADPARFFRLIPRKLRALFAPAHNLILDLSDLILIPFYVLALVRLIRRDTNWQIVGIVAFGLVLPTILVAVVFVGDWRYRIPMVPGLLLLAAYGVPEAWLSRVETVWQKNVGHRTLDGLAGVATQPGPSQAALPDKPDTK